MILIGIIATGTAEGIAWCDGLGGKCMKVGHFDGLRNMVGMPVCPSGYELHSEVSCGPGFKCCVPKYKPPVKECVSDADCRWCDTICKKHVPGEVCIAVMPPGGYDCVCENRKCTKVPIFQETCTKSETLIGIGNLKYCIPWNLTESITTIMEAIGRKIN